MASIDAERKAAATKQARWVPRLVEQRAAFNQAIKCRSIGIVTGYTGTTKRPSTQRCTECVERLALMKGFSESGIAVEILSEIQGYHRNVASLAHQWQPGQAILAIADMLSWRKQ